MTLNRDRPEILQPPQHPQACCTQQTITVPPEITAKTAQKHDYPSAAHRRSYARRTGAERGFATIKDPATTDITRGWCRLMGLTPLMLFTVMLLVVRNQRILQAWDTRQAENARRAAAGLPPRTRKRRRKTLTSWHRAAIARARPPSPARSPPRSSASMPANRRPGQKATSQAHHAPGTAGTRTTTTGAARMSDPNVNMVPTKT